MNVCPIPFYFGVMAAFSVLVRALGGDNCANRVFMFLFLAAVFIVM